MKATYHPALNLWENMIGDIKFTLIKFILKEGSLYS